MTASLQVICTYAACTLLHMLRSPELQGVGPVQGEDILGPAVSKLPSGHSMLHEPMNS